MKFICIYIHKNEQGEVRTICAEKIESLDL